MRKFLLVIVLLALALGAGFFWYQNQTAKEEEVELMPTVTRPDPSDATFVFEDGPVTLEDGKAATNLIPNSAISTETVLNENIVYGDVNGDDNNDAVVLLIQNSGGSGIFVYIAAYVSGNVAYKGSNAVFVGDRISPQTMTVSGNGVITLNYLDRNPGEAMAAVPTVPTTKTYVYSSGILEER